MGNCIFGFIKPYGFVHFWRDNDYKFVQAVNQENTKALQKLIDSGDLDVNGDVSLEFFYVDNNDNFRFRHYGMWQIPLVVAARCQSIKCIDVLLANGADCAGSVLYYGNLYEKIVGLFKIYAKERSWPHQKDINQLMILYCCHKINKFIFLL